MVLSNLVPRLHQPIQYLRFTTFLEKDFSVFRQSLKILWRQLLFFESAYWKYDKKEIWAPSKRHNFKILRNKLNEKAGLEIIFERCDLCIRKNNQLHNSKYDN